MFVDASAIVAIVTSEPDADALADAVDGARSAITSPIAVFEAAMAVCRKQRGSLAQAREDVAVFLDAAGVVTVSVTGRDAEIALDAATRYGKGRGHPAQLNMGDCFAYAVATTHGKALLFKGEDFSKTDIRSAI